MCCMYCTVGWAGLLYCSLCASCCTAASTYDCSSWAKACNPVVVASIRTLFLLFSTRTSFPARWIARTSETAAVCVLRLYCFRICCATPGKRHAHRTTKYDLWAFEYAAAVFKRLLRRFLAGGSSCGVSVSFSSSVSEAPKPTNVRASFELAFRSSAFASNS